MPRAKEAMLLLLVVVCWVSTPGGALTDDAKMVIDRLEEAELVKNPKVSYDERKFEDALTADSDHGADEDEDDEEAADADGVMSKLAGSYGPQDKRRHAFRSDLGKRSRLHYAAPDVDGVVAEKRYRSFKADLGKRYSRFRSDLGKRMDGFSTPEGSLGELERMGHGKDDLEVDPLYLTAEKRPRFRADLGKRARYEASRRVFRADLGKRRMFRSDLG